VYDGIVHILTRSLCSNIASLLFWDCPTVSKLT